MNKRRKLLVGLILTIIIAVGLWGRGLVKQDICGLSTGPSGESDNEVRRRVEATQPTLTKPLNLLVVGIDQRVSENSRTDTIMVYHLDPTAKAVSLLSVPRDTYVNIPGRGMDKINHAHAFGGIELSRQTLQEFLGIPIDYYVETNFTGFVSLIDRLGGINVYVEKDIAGTDIRRGQQRLDGQRALAYVRDRRDPMGDIARVQRQQRFMKALAREVADYESKWKLALEIPAIYKSLETNLPLEKARELYRFIQEADLEKSRMEEVPGWFYNLRGISYWKPDQEKTKQLVKNMFIYQENLPGSDVAVIKTN